MGLEPLASNDVSDGATVSVPAEWPDERADPGRVRRVGRESWDIKQLNDFPELYEPPGILRDRPGPANLQRASLGSPASAGRSILWGLAVLLALTRGPSKAANPLRPSNHR
jgi:hypothetical protein